MIRSVSVGVLVIALSICLAPHDAKAQSTGDGLIVKKSDFPATKTMDRLGLALERAGIKVFARIKHQAGAEAVGMLLRPTEVMIFGSPKIGTPLMQSNQAIGLDLPLRAVAWEDGSGATYVAYLDPSRLKSRYAITDRDPVFDKVAGALNKLTDMAVKKGGLPQK